MASCLLSFPDVLFLVFIVVYCLAWCRFVLPSLSCLVVSFILLSCIGVYCFSWSRLVWLCCRAVSGLVVSGLAFRSVLLASWGGYIWLLHLTCAFLVMSLVRCYFCLWPVGLQVWWLWLSTWLHLIDAFTAVYFGLRFLRWLFVVVCFVMIIFRCRSL